MNSVPLLGQSWPRKRKFYIYSSRNLTLWRSASVFRGHDGDGTSGSVIWRRVCIASPSGPSLISSWTQTKTQQKANRFLQQSNGWHCCDYFVQSLELCPQYSLQYISITSSRGLHDDIATTLERVIKRKQQIQNVPLSSTSTSIRMGYRTCRMWNGCWFQIVWALYSSRELVLWVCVCVVFDASFPRWLFVCLLL